MKRVIAICLMCALSSCATTDSANLRSKHVSQRQLNASGYDEAYMAKVEKIAGQHGVIVKWINPPKAPKAKKDGTKKDGK
ncbi:MAG: hypothetical protein ACREO1_12470 [Arenimonas sp.]